MANIFLTSSPVYRHLCQLPLRQAVKSITATCVRPYSAPPPYPALQPGEASERCYSAPCVLCVCYPALSLQGKVSYAELWLLMLGYWGY